MFAPTRYIVWAIEHYGRVAYDLAASGIPLVNADDFGATPDLFDPKGYEALRGSIAKYNDLPEAEVVAALGTTQALFLAYGSVLVPGDDVLVEHPGYEPLTRTAEGLGATVRTFERRREDGYRVDPDRVAAAMTPRTRLVVVTDHHNPTGVRVGTEAILEIARIAEAQGAYVLVDEVYAPFEALPDDGVFRHSARKLAPNILAIGSLTKCYGLGMFRVGWLLGPAGVVARAADAQVAASGHLPLAHACLGAAAFAAVPRLAARAKRLTDGKRAMAEAWVAKHPQLRWSAPASGLFGFVTVDGAGDLRPTIEACLDKNGVLVGPGTFFGAPDGFRLSWATCEPTRFAEGLARLGPIIGG